MTTPSLIQQTVCYGPDGCSAEIALGVGFIILVAKIILILKSRQTAKTTGEK